LSGAGKNQQSSFDRARVISRQKLCGDLSRPNVSGIFGRWTCFEEIMAGGERIVETAFYAAGVKARTAFR